MKAKFREYETLSGKFEYLINNENLPKMYNTFKQALDSSSKILEETEIIKSNSGKKFFIIKKAS